MTDEIDRLSSDIGGALQKKRWMLATAESCTGGGVGEAVTRTAGSSAWFDRGFITYTNDAKQELLGVHIETLSNQGAVSEESAREMAAGALRESSAQIAVSVTGVAGPSGGTATKPVGMVCFAWATLEGYARTDTQMFSGDRATIRRQAIVHALQGVLEATTH